ncbi:MAG: 1-acyl-sn-glycerol-3-phosphate acyltransferase [Rubrivivax sp.]|nr:1-acyl-sn-glycerol-3-phosphate acyltransferase [Rubrivivax sp.]
MSTGAAGVPAAAQAPAAGAAAPPSITECIARPIRPRGSRAARAALRLLGWELVWDGLPGPQGVLVAYPHTSNWDFLYTMLARWAIGVPAHWWAKASLFRVPLVGRWMHWIGGLPVERASPQGSVGQMVTAIDAARRDGRLFWLALTPEGTRSHGAGWRSGFYRIAQGAGVPVALGIIDYGRRRVGIDSFWLVSGDIDADFAVFAARLAGCRGLHADLAAPVRPL